MSHKNPKLTLHRRTMLRGLGGVTLALPFLEGLVPRNVSAQSAVGPYAIFFRQANGVAAAQDTELGSEPERFWPREFGTLDAANVAGRALDELGDHLDKLLVLRNVNMEDFDYGDGHARGALQCLTGRDPYVSGAGGNSEASGESLDHRIGRQLNPPGRDSLFLYAGSSGGWLGGPCISYRGENNRRSALHNPWTAYENLIGSEGGLSDLAAEQLLNKRESVNDLVRGQLGTLLKRKDLSARDRERLDLHLTSVRELENQLTCQLTQSEQMVLAGFEEIYESNDGDNVLSVARAHMDIATLAVSCGLTRSVAIQVGNGNDGASQYRDPDTTEMMENYHYISHRRFSHDSSGDLLSNADLLHHKIDRMFAQTFRHLIERLAAIDVGGSTLLDAGVSVWLNDLGNGPGHSANNVPYILAGSAGGFFKQGSYIELDGGDWETRNHVRVLNSIATAVGCTSAGKDYCDDVGEDRLDRSPHPELEA